MDSDVETAAAVIVSIICKRKRKRNKRKKRSVWVKPWLLRRNALGVCNTLMLELRSEELHEYRRFLRMTPEIFDEILHLVEPYIKKESTILRDAIPAKMKLAATLRYLSTGTNYSDLQHMFRIHKSTLSKFIPEVCEAIFMRLKDKYLKVRYFFNHVFKSYNQNLPSKKIHVQSQ